MAKCHVHGSLTRMERQSKTVEDADGRRDSPISSNAPNFRFCSFDRILGLRNRTCSRGLALDYFRTLLRHWGRPLGCICCSDIDGSYAVALEVGRLHPS